MLITLKLGLFQVCSCLVEPRLLNYLLHGGDARRIWHGAWDSPEPVINSLLISIASSLGNAHNTNKPEMTPDVSSDKAVLAHYKPLISSPHSNRRHWSSYDSHR